MPESSTAIFTPAPVRPRACKAEPPTYGTVLVSETWKSTSGRIAETPANWAICGSLATSAATISALYDLVTRPTSTPPSKRICAISASCFCLSMAA